MFSFFKKQPINWELTEEGHHTQTDGHWRVTVFPTKDRRGFSFYAVEEVGVDRMPPFVSKLFKTREEALNAASTFLRLSFIAG